MVGCIPDNWRSLVLSKNFKLGEFYVSHHYQEIAMGMEPAPRDIDNFFMLCSFGLQLVRNRFGRIVITSGYRTPELNDAVGGQKDSQHLKALAADISSLDTSPLTIWLWLKRFWKGDLIYYKSENMIHIGLPEYGVKPDSFIK